MEDYMIWRLWYLVLTPIVIGGGYGIACIVEHYKNKNKDVDNQMEKETQRGVNK